KKIIRLVDDYAISKATPKTIDDSVARHQLNHLEAVHMARVIKKLGPSISYVDSCDVNPDRFGREITSLSKTGKVRSYHHADSRFVVVSAASIVAKVTRDRAIEKIGSLYPIGSGYPSDSRTVKFVRDWFLAQGQVPAFVRKSWAPVRMILSS
ncbi:MAG TPA: ribonuclease HII, partial [Candidatus Nitrosotenuis sp.]|nr:ribonuclease HII [Candidatus Nitrosotenuis sp.]